MNAAFDIVVLGGGPAGSLSAVLLVRAGYRVALVSQPRRFAAIEGIAPRAVAALESYGFTSALEALNAQVQRRVSWNGQLSAANSEHVIERARFDAGLLADARRAGVVIIGARAGRMEAGAERWRITLRGAPADCVVAAFVLDARGRAAPLLGARRTMGPPTTALAQAWRLPRTATPHTALAAFDDGWVWFAAVPGGRGVLQVLVSSDTGELPGRGAMAAHYKSLVARVAEAQAWLEGARPLGRVSARAASASLVRPLARSPLLRVGDAATSIDPLSGHGLFEALASALAAGPVVNTLLARPELEHAALRYYEERAEDAFWRNARVGRAFYAQETRWMHRSFWSARREWPDTLPPHAAPSSAEPVIERRPVVKDALVVLEDVVVTPDHPRGVWQVAGVPLVELLRALGDRQLKTEQAAALLQCSMSRVQTARSWLVHRGLIRPAVDPGRPIRTD
ncbi:MAG: flavin-dependent monooxygenase QhpG [Gammaproteobacteria bacterium]